MSTINRREFLRLTAVVAAGPAVSCGDDAPPPEIPDRAVFPHSVASGDPRPDAIVLWTRAVDPDRPGQDLTVSLEVATDERFGAVVARLEGLAAPALHDHVVKVKVTGLTPATRYFYRFRARRGATTVSSPVGRTRTAPSADQAVKVRLAFASCQDYNGRYYNAWQALVDRAEDLDFVLFLGDYVYEGEGDDGSAAGTNRRISFSDPAGALVAGGGRVAQSLSNYRDLYRAVRSDPLLQRVHELYPFVVIWDDHEFSNDCWGAHATYTSGAFDELQIDRRRSSEQAFFEYLPIDVPPGAGPGVIDVGAAPLHPEARIYRELTFGAYLRLALTDYRSYRPDHLVPEDAYPGALFLTSEALENELQAGRLPSSLKERLAGAAFAAVDIDTAPMMAVKATLLAAATDEATKAGLSAERAAQRAGDVVRGTLALAYVNAVLKARGQEAMVIAPTPEQPRGLAFVHLGKRSWFTSVGARYVLIEDIFQIYAKLLYARSGGASERALGQAQEDWLSGLVAAPRNQGWTIVTSSVSMSTLALDLTGKMGIPPELQARYLFTAEQWDGFPNKKAELLARYAAANGGRTLVLSGDIHAAYASVEGGVPCLTGPAISSSTASEDAGSAVAGYGLDPKDSSLALLIAFLDALFKQANPGMVLSDTHSHGLVVLEVDRDSALATFHLIPATEVRTSYAGRSQELRGRIKTLSFRVEPGKITPLT